MHPLILAACYNPVSFPSFDMFIGRVTRALPPKYLNVENYQQCLIDLVKPGGSDGYYFPSSRPADCPKSVWRKLKREYKGNT